MVGIFSILCESKSEREIHFPAIFYEQHGIERNFDFHKTLWIIIDFIGPLYLLFECYKLTRKIGKDISKQKIEMEKRRREVEQIRRNWRMSENPTDNNVEPTETKLSFEWVEKTSIYFPIDCHLRKLSFVGPFCKNEI